METLKLLLSRGASVEASFVHEGHAEASRDYLPPLPPPKKPAGKAKVWTLEAVEKLTVPKLKSELKKLKLDQAGRKAELKQRLLEGLGLAKAE
ncbi:hypothetical protein JL721_9739 [Aureococcus anophagefferens]|nr:hypothetical protein JL721_9739 [Aureococcus anophagefferens]